MLFFGLLGILRILTISCRTSSAVSTDNILTAFAYATHSSLAKTLHFAIYPSVLPIEAIVGGSESLFSVSHGHYTVTLGELKSVLQNSAAKLSTTGPKARRHPSQKPVTVSSSKKDKSNVSSHEERNQASKKPVPSVKPMDSKWQSNKVVVPI